MHNYTYWENTISYLQIHMIEQFEKSPKGYVKFRPYNLNIGSC